MATSQDSSVDISIGMLLMPAPGTLDNLVQIGIDRLPTQVISNALTRRHQPGGVARTSRPQHSRNLDARDTLRCIDDLSHAESFAIAEVVGAVARIERAQCQGMRLRKIEHVDIFPHTGAIRGWVVVPKNRDAVPLPDAAEGPAESNAFRGMVLSRDSLAPAALK